MYKPFIVYEAKYSMLGKKLAECRTLEAARKFVKKHSKGSAECTWKFDGSNEDWGEYAIRRW